MVQKHNKPSKPLHSYAHVTRANLCLDASKENTNGTYSLIINTHLNIIRELCNTLYIIRRKQINKELANMYGKVTTFLNTIFGPQSASFDTRTVVLLAWGHRALALIQKQWHCLLGATER